MYDNRLVISFSGSLADQHRLPAYAGTQSLSGIARSILIPMMYLAEGKVRHRKLSHRGFELDLVATRPGSFESVYELISNPGAMIAWEFLANVGIDVAKDFAVDFVKSIINRSVGNDASENIEDLERDGRLPIGDVHALVDAVEPAVKQAHASIGNGASNILIINGDRNVVKLDARTKAFVMSAEEDPDVRDMDFSIGSFNANTGYGRAFHYQDQRTIPFVLSGQADAKTVNAILASLSEYTRVKRFGEGQVSRVRLTYTTIVAPDGRVKKMEIIKARNIVSM
ncbi:hypothetical protein [Hyphomicrobium sulfonivorans]|uniref:DUF7946 domain-containing protein n=1 Tax=Hyphomicrobium sulfonivorans TaxID=121290 RepID=UPI001570DFAB|nr:hypothetical protein [Hyphomicrobium sulfonivorans]MBI1650045.1 hypothetical protein [Hyphomicrobium sulfonivorans]